MTEHKKLIAISPLNHSRLGKKKYESGFETMDDVLQKLLDEDEVKDKKKSRNVFDVTPRY